MTGNNGYMLQKISQLPNMLQDYILSYNVEHRQMMKNVFDELIYYYEELPCEYDRCGGIVRRIDPNKVIHYRYGEEHCWCCACCKYCDSQ